MDLYRHGEGRWVKYDDHVVEVGQWAATVARVTNERDDEHLARVKAEAEVERLRVALRYCRDLSNDPHVYNYAIEALEGEHGA